LLLAFDLNLVLQQGHEFSSVRKNIAHNETPLLSYLVAEIICK